MICSACRHLHADVNGTEQQQVSGVRLLKEGTPAPETCLAETQKDSLI
jgi:hypothetical protein